MNDQQDNFQVSALAAFADGELEGSEAADVSQQVAQNPQASATVHHHQQLRLAVKRVLSLDVPRIPADLRDTVEAIAKQVVSGQDQASTLAEHVSDPPPAPEKAASASPPVIGRIGRWIPAAVAAVLFISSLAALYQASLQSASSGSYGIVMTASQRQTFGKRHNECAGDPTLLHENESFPKTLQALPDKLASYLKNTTTLSLDLSKLGYIFKGAGRCQLPGQGAAHLVYQSEDQQTSLSLWIKPYKGTQRTLALGKVYAVNDELAEHPILVWRDAKMVYYLVGDNPIQVGQAAGMLRK